MNDEQEQQYRSYLLRLWQESLTFPAVWRASLEDPQTGERFGFPGIGQLFAFLQERVGVVSPDLDGYREHSAASPPPAHSGQAMLTNPVDIVRPEARGIETDKQLEHGGMEK